MNSLGDLHSVLRPASCVLRRTADASQSALNTPTFCPGSALDRRTQFDEVASDTAPSLRDAGRRTQDAGPRTSRRFSISILAMLLVFTACSAPPRDLSSDEAKRIAWWCEDWSHGIPREVGELRTDDASAGLLRIADWAAAAETSSAKHHLRQRRQRWPVVQSLLVSGILITTDEGLLVLAPGQAGDTADLAQTVADSENQDRRTVEVLCLTMAQTDERMTPALKRAFAAARRADDLAATPTLAPLPQSTPP